MNRSLALKQATSHVNIVRMGDRWCVIGPHDYAKPHGPSGEHVVQHYHQAVKVAALWRASVALALMDRLTNRALDIMSDACWWVDNVSNARTLVTLAINAPMNEED